MKCWICGAEMTNTIGGCYTCENCHMAGINDCVMRYPSNLDFSKYQKKFFSPLNIELDGNEQNENFSFRRIN